MKLQSKQRKFRNLWILGICIHILVFLFVLDLYFTSPIKHGMTPHKTEGEAFAKRVVVFIADGLRAEAIYPKDNWDRVKYLSDLRLNKSCSWGVIHTGVPTESRPGHVAIFAGLLEDPSALFTGWQANTVEFDSVINQSNYAWSYGSPDIVKIFTKKDKAKLYVDYYDPDQEDFSGRTSTINLDTWVFDNIEDLLTPKGNSCEAEFIRKSTQRRRINELNVKLIKERAECKKLIENCERNNKDCLETIEPCVNKIAKVHIPATLREAELDLQTLDLSSCLDNFDYIECEQLCRSGNIFFLHLLGMDTVGHVHKPDSKEYIENLAAIDVGIRETTYLFEEFFRDNDTAFLLTADHGMTNWGSHGDGSEHETEVPYILWGKGVQENKLRYDLKQTDLAPLLSSIIGVPIPINSIGILPHKLLNGTYPQISHAVLANVMQHVEQYKLLLGEFDLDPLFIEYPSFQHNYVDTMVKKMRQLQNGGDKEKNVVRMGVEFMKDILAANSYMRNYYFKPKVVSVMLGFFLWIIYLSLSIHVRDETRHLAGSRINKWRLGTRLFTTCLMIIVFVYLKGLQVKYCTYLYPVFVLGVLTLFSEDKDVVNQLWIILNIQNRTKFMTRTFIYAVLVQLLVFGFFNRMFCACVVVILAFWLTQNGLPVKNKVTWLVTTCTLSLLQIFEPSTKFNYYGLGIGSILWIMIYVTCIYPNAKDYIKRFDLKYKTMTRNIILIPLVTFLISGANALYVAHAFDTESGLSDMNLVVSWAVTAAILLMIPAAPKGVLTRFGHICACLIVPYALMAVNIDLIFYSILVLTLYYWMDIESKMHSPKNEEYPLIQLHFTTKYVPAHTVKVSALYRRTYFYLALTVCYFFAIGNMASFNGFDPQWTRTYVATFNPFLMAALIVIKMIIPFFLITCAFYAIVLHTKANETTVFTVLLLFLDQMVLSFMLFVRNEGSWLEIGKSLSHFAVMEAMALVMLIFFGLARYVCSFRIGDAGTGYEPPDDYQDDTDTNIGRLIQEGKRRVLKENADCSNKIKKGWWYFRNFISNLSKSDSALNKDGESLLKTQNLTSNPLNITPTIINYYVNEKRNSRSEKRETKVENVSPLKTNVSESISLEKLFSGTKMEIFQAAFDLGVKTTLEQRGKRKKLKTNDEQSKSTKKQKSLTKISNSYQDIKKFVKNNYNTQNAEEYNRKTHWEGLGTRGSNHNIYNLTYYDIFPTVDKIQAKELRTIHNAPFSYEDGYLNIRNRFEKNAEGENVGMISRPSYDDVDCHFYSTVYSATQSTSSLKQDKKFRASYFKKRSYRALKRINSVPNFNTSFKITDLYKVPSENDVGDRLCFDEGTQSVNSDSKEEKQDTEANCLKKQLEKFNLSKSVYCTIDPSMKLTSKISIIRTESYFDPNELGPAGSRIFRGSRTTFNAPDVLKLAPGLSREESAYYFMPEAQKSALIQKLLASSRAKTLHEQNLINSYFKQLIRSSPCDLMSCSGSSTVSSIHDIEDPFEILHKEAVRNQKRRRREHRQRVRQWLELAKQREKDRLVQEKLSIQRAEDALKAEEEKKLLEMANKRSSLINLVSSQAVFNLGVKTDSPIKVVESCTTEKRLLLDLPEEDEVKVDDTEDKPINIKPDVKALECFKEIAQVKPDFSRLLDYFEVDKSPEGGSPVGESQTSQMTPKPGNYPFREVRKKQKQPETKSPFIDVPAKRKKHTEPDTSSESEGEGTSNDKRKKRKKIKKACKFFVELPPVKDDCSNSNEPNSCNNPKPEDNSTKLDKTDQKKPNLKPKPKKQPEPCLSDAGDQPTSKTNDDASKSTQNSTNSTPRTNKSPSPPCRDRYDKTCCIRKRPSAKFISNAHEMAMRLSRLPKDQNSDEPTDTSSSEIVRIARLPIRIVPGILATGFSSSIKSPGVCKKKSEFSSSFFLQPPSEDIIKEEREMEPSSSSKSTSKVKSNPGSKHKPFMRSSPTLMRLHSNSTLITEPKASEDRLNRSQQSSSATTVTSSSESEVMPNISLVRSTMSGFSDNLVGKDLDSDPSSMFSDLPEDDVKLSSLSLSKSRSKSNSARDGAISFEGVTTSLKKQTPTIGKQPNTCYDLLSLEPSNEDLQQSGDEDVDINNLNNLSNPDPDKICTPRFLQSDSDPAKYLVKVESWLKSIDVPNVPQQCDTYHVSTTSEVNQKLNTVPVTQHNLKMVTQEEQLLATSESSISSNDLLGLHDDKPENDGITLSQDCLKKLNDDVDVYVPTIDEQALISIEIAKLLMEEQDKTQKPRFVSLVEAYQTVKYVFRCARNIKASNSKEDLSIEASKQVRMKDVGSLTSLPSSTRVQSLKVQTNTISTQITPIPVDNQTKSIQMTPLMINKLVGSDSRLDSMDFGTQTTQKLTKAASKVRLRSKSTQYVIDTLDKCTLTDDLLLEKVTSNIGIQHSFSEIGVNTDRSFVGQQVGIGIQCNSKMVDVGTHHKSGKGLKVIEKRDVGVSPCIKYQRKKSVLSHQNIDMKNYSNVTSVAGTSTSSDNEDWMMRGSMGEGDMVFETSEVVDTSPELSPNLQKPISSFERTVQNLRAAFASKTKNQVVSNTSIPSISSQGSLSVHKEDVELQDKVRTKPVLPDELCSKADLEQKKLEHLEQQKFVDSCKVVGKLDLIVEEEPPDLVPCLSLEVMPCGNPPPKLPKDKTKPSRLKSDLGLGSPSGVSKKKRGLTTKTPKAPKKLGVRKPPTPGFQKVQTPQDLEKLMSTYARIEASKPYKPALQAIEELEGRPNPRPKVKSVPRTDYAELPEEHQAESDGNFIKNLRSHSTITGAYNTTTAPTSASAMASNLKKQSTLSKSSKSKSPRSLKRHSFPSSQLNVSNAATRGSSVVMNDSDLTDPSFPRVIQEWRQQGWSEAQIYREILKRQAEFQTKQTKQTKRRASN